MIQTSNHAVLTEKECIAESSAGRWSYWLRFMEEMPCVWSALKS